MDVGERASVQQLGRGDQDHQVAALPGEWSLAAGTRVAEVGRLRRFGRTPSTRPARRLPQRRIPQGPESIRDNFVAVVVGMHAINRNQSLRNRILVAVRTH
jgi:hypothetical protein